MSIYSIYRIINLVNQMVYIGFTSQTPSARWISHKAVSRRPNGKQHMYIHRAIAKYGVGNFVFEVIYQSNDRDHTLNDMEVFFIKQHNSFGDGGYNLSGGGESGMNGRVHTEETKSKIGAAHRGKYVSDETRSKIGEKSKGRIPSEETRAKLSASWKPCAARSRPDDWVVTHPDGKEERITNLKAFCNANGLFSTTMCQVAKGKRKHHKGYRCTKL